MDISKENFKNLIKDLITQKLSEFIDQNGQKFPMFNISAIGDDGKQWASFFVDAISDAIASFLYDLVMDIFSKVKLK